MKSFNEKNFLIEGASVRNTKCCMCRCTFSFSSTAREEGRRELGFSKEIQALIFQNFLSKLNRTVGYLSAGKSDAQCWVEEELKSRNCQLKSFPNLDIFPVLLL